MRGPAKKSASVRPSLARWLDLGFVALGAGAFALLAREAVVGGPGTPTEFALGSEEAVRALGGEVVLVSARPEPYLVRADGTRVVEGDSPSEGAVLASIALSAIVLEREGRTVTIVVD